MTIIRPHDSDDSVDDPDFVLTTTESDCDADNNRVNRDKFKDFRHADDISDSTFGNAGTSGEADSENSERETPKRVHKPGRVWKRQPEKWEKNIAKKKRNLGLEYIACSSKKL